MPVQDVYDLIRDVAGIAQYVCFPKAQDGPPCGRELLSLATIAFDISLYLGDPVGRVVPTREPHKADIEVTPMPEVAIAEDHEAIPREKDVGAAE